MTFSTQLIKYFQQCFFQALYTQGCSSPLPWMVRVPQEALNIPAYQGPAPDQLNQSLGFGISMGIFIKHPWFKCATR